MGIYTIILLLIIIIGLLAIVYINIYNHMQYSKTKIEKAENNIDNDLREKYDLVVKTDTIIKEHFQEKIVYFKEFIIFFDSVFSLFVFECILFENNYFYLI